MLYVEGMLGNGRTERAHNNYKTVNNCVLFVFCRKAKCYDMANAKYFILGACFIYMRKFYG